jgi:hypothetical protein
MRWNTDSRLDEQIRLWKEKTTTMPAELRAFAMKLAFAKM